MSPLEIGLLAGVVVVALAVILIRSREKTIDAPSQMVTTAAPPAPPQQTYAEYASGHRAIDASEVAVFRDWLAGATLPALCLDSDAKGPVGAGGCRIGGPAWLPEGEAWPVDSAGAPLELVAQIDFSALPSLPGYPEQGLLQFFVKRDDVFGADFDDPIHGEARIAWRPELVGGALHAPPPLVELPGAPFSDFSPIMDDKVREAGLPLVATPFEGTVDANSLQVRERVIDLVDRPGFEQIQGTLQDHVDNRPFCHQVGGHPAFMQPDFREVGRYDDYDRVLLRLTSDEAVGWGDGGEAAFLIRAEDLARRDFSKAIFYWDCL